MARFPVDAVRVTPHGKYNQVRRSKADGACGVHSYPCTHPGLDLANPIGGEVYAPEDGTIETISSGHFPPFTGYDPGIIVIRGKSGVWHWLAHENVGTIVSATVPGDTWDWLTTPVWKSTAHARTVREGQLIGLTGDPAHVHWEVHERAWNGARMSPARWLHMQGYVGLDLRQFEGDAGGDDGWIWLAVLWAASQ